MGQTPSRKDHEDVLEGLRWGADTVVENYEGERVWLRPCLDGLGRRIGITDCCREDDPCGRHGRIRAGTGGGK